MTPCKERNSSQRWALKFDRPGECDQKYFAQVQEIQQELESLKISISQMALECYPFALPTDTPTHAHAHKITFQSPSAAAKEVSISEPAPPPPQRKGATFAVGLASPSDSSARYLYEVENGAEVLMRLESSGIQLEVHLASPHLGPLRQKAEALLDTVSKLRELVSLLLQCQEQVCCGSEMRPPVKKSREPHTLTSRVHEILIFPSSVAALAVSGEGHQATPPEDGQPARPAEGRGKVPGRGQEHPHRPPAAVPAGEEAWPEGLPGAAGGRPESHLQFHTATAGERRSEVMPLRRGCI